MREERMNGGREDKWRKRGREEERINGGR
jgi:hypothetical protein